MGGPPGGTQDCTQGTGQAPDFDGDSQPDTGTDSSYSSDTQQS